MSNYVVIESEKDLLFNWYDDRVPNMCGCFIETSLDECTTNEHGQYLASYEPYVVNQETEIIYLKYIENAGNYRSAGKTKFILQPGIYLLHPKDIQP